MLESNLMQEGEKVLWQGPQNSMGLTAYPLLAIPNLLSATAFIAMGVKLLWEYSKQDVSLALNLLTLTAVFFLIGLVYQQIRSAFRNPGGHTVKSEWIVTDLGVHAVCEGCRARFAPWDSEPAFRLHPPRYWGHIPARLELSAYKGLHKSFREEVFVLPDGLADLSNTLDGLGHPIIR